MKWSMDTHKFMSEITRKALQIIVAHGVTSESDAEAIAATENELADEGIYRSREAASGRIRRALFTYFKAYGCLDTHEGLTEIGRLFVENKITVQEMCFHYVLNYHYSDDDSEYYPVRLLLTCIKKLSERATAQGYLSAYDFSQIVECQSLDDINDAFIDALIEARNNDPIEVNERSIGFDVWSNILISAGIFNKTTDKTLVIRNRDLTNWILEAYNNEFTVVPGQILTGIFSYLPLPELELPTITCDNYTGVEKALRAFLFDNIDNRIIEKYIYEPQTDLSFKEVIQSLCLDENSKGFYRAFLGLEQLVGYCLVGNEHPNYSRIGRIITSVELTEADLTEVMPNIININYDLFERKEGGHNTLLYGVPGSGKSWTIEHEFCKEGVAVERLVFHPDYTNADFVGQILPVVDEDKQVTYEFTPGPFTTIVKAAYKHPQRNYVLIIEEINRGNAPAIFGEVFQLLDRMVEAKNIDGIEYPKGTSEYGITHKYMADEIYGNPAQKIRIPSNLSIVGTMNTSDQNVFTLDTAFQRRWRMRLIENNFNNVRGSLADATILDTEVTWKHFCETINSIIIGNKVKMASAEDKRLGVYFIHENDIVFDERALPSADYATISEEYNDLVHHETVGDITEEQKNRLEIIRDAVMHNRLFPEKVIKYLWDDAFKFNPEGLFDTDNMDSLEKVIRTFVYSSGSDRFRVFKQTVRDSLYPAQQQ